MDLRNIVFAMFLMSGVIMGFTTFYIDLATQDRDPTVPNINLTDELETFRLIDKASAIVNATDNSLFSQLTGIPVLGEIAALTVQGMAVLQTAMIIPQFFFAMGQDLSRLFFIPPWAVNIIYGLVSTALIFIMLSALLKWRI